jgi:hypothetical protein
VGKVYSVSCVVYSFTMKKEAVCSPKCRYVYTKLHGHSSKQAVVVIAVRTSYLTDLSQALALLFQLQSCSSRHIVHSNELFHIVCP